MAMLFISVPVAWFGRRVLKPLQSLTAFAQRIAGTPGKARLPKVKAITEINEFADAFNHSQERIAALTQELHSVNDHLAHELKTPLARVRGNIEDLLDHYGDDDGLEAASRSLDEIDRTSELIRNILAIRLGDSGAMRLHLELTQCFEFISDIVETYTPAAEERDLEFAFESESEGFVLMDRQRMRHAVTNLLDNAFAYTPKGGSVTVVQSVDQDGLTLRVQDSGPGLTSEDEQRIWERFVRGSAGTKDAPGTGLGLPLVRAVARAHAGDASCRNRTEGGAEFWIYIPSGPRVI
jgi:signal transduction histidine kinase